MAIESYDDKSIQTLSAIEHIRKRTGMYIGRTGDGSQYEDGIYILLKEVLDNAVDEFIMGCGKRIDISLDYNSGAVAIRDYGRGIPLGKVVDCVSNSRLCRAGFRRHAAGRSRVQARPSHRGTPRVQARR